MKKYKQNILKKKLYNIKISYLGGRISWWEYTKRILKIYFKFYR